jgi:hypothetical protein
VKKLLNSKMKTLQKILIAGAVALKLIGAGLLIDGSLTKNQTREYVGASTFLVGGVVYLATNRLGYSPKE